MINLQKRTLLQSLISLISISIIVKIVATIAKVTTTRIVGIEATGLYMLINPCMVFLINLTQLSLPTVISKLIASNKNKTKVLITTSVILFSITLVSMFLILIFSKPFALEILKNEGCIMPLKALSLLIPLISIGSIIKGYYMGIGNIAITAKSQISEEIGRLVFIIAFGSSFLSTSISFAATCCIYSLCFGEICSLTHMIIYLIKQKQEKVHLLDELANKNNYIFKEVLSISLPLTSSRIISSFTYFLEPIILTFLLLRYGYDSSAISIEYGTLNGYAMPLILMPGFFSGIYGKILLPEMSNLNANKNYQHSYNLFIKFLIITLLTGISFSIIILIFKTPLLNLLYGSNIGEKYITTLTIPFLIYYLESPISSALTSLSLNKETFKIGIYSAIFRITILIISLEKFGILAVAISELAGVLTYVILGLFYVLRKFFSYNIHPIFFQKCNKNITNTNI